MILSGPEYIDCDVLVMGGGGAGLRAAIEARQAGVSVLLVSKSQVGLGNNTALSTAAFPAAGSGDDRDSPNIHMQDTVKAGCFINDMCLAKKISGEIVEEVSFLEKFGVSFQKKGRIFVTEKVPGHTYSRHVLGKSRRGTDLTLPLKEFASRIGVRFAERVFISRLLIRGKGITAIGIDKRGCLLIFQARAVVMATGGFGQIYLHTNNAVGTTGDGLALAFNLGIPLRDMEFVQFYPTAIAGIRLFPYEIFVFLHGAILKNSLGEDIVHKHGLYDPMVMTRDRLTRAIMREILEGRDVEGGVVVDLSPVPNEGLIHHRTLLPAALLGKKEFIVFPTAHFSIGGIAVDENACTSIPALFACGEISGGAHGANRLAGNALAEVFVMGRAAGQNAALVAQEACQEKPDPAEAVAEKKRLESLLGEQDENIEEILRSLKEIMWYQVGIIRNKSGLEKALEKIKEIRLLAQRVRASSIRGLTMRLELDNMLLLAELVTKAALERCESRGVHYREDYPNEDPRWCASLFIVNRNGKIRLEKRSHDESPQK